MSCENKKCCDCVCENEVKPIHVISLLDASGSMNHIANHALAALNEYIDGERKYNPKFTLISFNQETKTIIDYKDINEVQNISPDDYNCFGMTALYDAILEATNYRPNNEQMIVIIQTDGEDNSSTTRIDTIEEIIEQRKSEGWVFKFIGTGLSEEKTNAMAKSINIDLKDTISLQASQAGMQDYSIYLSASTQQHRNV